MNTLLSSFKGLPIKWKITIWSSAFLFILFLSYIILQYFVIDQRTTSYEKQNVKHQLNEVIAFIQSNHHPLTMEEIKQGESDISKINQKGQIIRIIDQNGKILINDANDVNESGLKFLPLTNQGFSIYKKGEDSFLILQSPIVTAQFTGTIEIIRNMEMFDDFINNIFIVLIAAGIGGLILSFLGGTFLSRQLLSNVSAITDTMNKIKINGLKERVPIYETNDEIAQLGKLFNELMDDLEGSFIQQKQFVEDASHELRTPLAIIQGHLSMLNRWGKRDPEILDKSLNSSLKEVDRLIKLVQELLELSRAEAVSIGPTGVKPINVTNLIQFVIRNFEVLYSDFTFQIRVDEENLYVAVPSRHLEQIIIILLDNAVKFSKEEKEVSISCKAENQKVTIKVVDKGIGIPEQDIPYVLNRFYRADKARSRKQGGLGLGLAIAKRWVEKYDGMIQIFSQEGHGTTFSITFPMASRPSIDE